VKLKDLREQSDRCGRQGRLGRARRLWVYVLWKHLTAGDWRSLLVAIERAKDRGLYARTTYYKDIAVPALRRMAELEGVARRDFYLWMTQRRWTDS